MVMQAQLADGRILEFPDGTDPNVIQQTVKRLIGDQNGTITDRDVDIVGETRDFQSRGAGLIDLFAEPAATLVTGAIAEPIAGLAGIAQTINPFAEPGAGARAVQATREALTFQPRTRAGQAGLQAVGETLAPIGEVFEAAETFLGDKTFELTGSPALAAGAASLPTLFTEILGVAAGKGAVRAGQKAKKNVRQTEIDNFISAAAPSSEQLKDVAREVYKEIDNLGISLQPKAYKGLVNKIQIEANRLGLDPDVTPKSFKAIKRFAELESPSLTEIDIVRKVAQNAARDLTNLGDAAIGSTIIDTLDQFLDNIRPTGLKKPAGVDVDIGKRYKIARDLWGRARRSELLQEAFDKARRQASGFENGLRRQFNQILNNTKKKRFFKKDEILAMERVVLGSKKENLARLIGKLGFGGSGRSSQLVGGAIGAAGGATVGSAIGGAAGAGVGAIVLPLIGEVSKALAQRMTRGNADFADQVIRAGADAKKITRVYIRNTDKTKRTSQELSELLMRNDIDLNNIPDLDIAREAAQIAAQNRAALVGAVTVGGEQ